MKTKFFFCFLFTFLGSCSYGASALSDFRNILRILIENSTSIQTQKALVEAAEKYKTSKFFYWTPSAQFTLLQPLPGADTGYSKTMGAEVRLNLWKFGADQSGYNAASARLRAENARFGQSKQDFELSAAKLLFQIIRQNKIIDIQKRHLGLREESNAVAKERFKQGQLAIQELEKVKIELETSKIKLAEAELVKIELKDVLKSLVEVDIDISEWPYTSELKQLRKHKHKDIKDFYKVRANLADSEFYTFQAKEIWKSSYLPTLDFTASWNQPNFGPIKQGEWTAYFGVTIPLWDRLSGRASTAEKMAASRGAELTYEQSVRETKAQLNSLDTRLELTKSNVQSSLRAAEKLEELRNDSLKRFRLGRSTVNDLLIDENRFLEAEASLLNSMSSYHELLVENCHAVDESLLNCY
jgi:outer membrane protein TolC